MFETVDEENVLIDGELFNLKEMHRRINMIGDARLAHNANGAWGIVLNYYILSKNGWELRKHQREIVANYIKKLKKMIYGRQHNGIV